MDRRDGSGSAAGAALDRLTDTLRWIAIGALTIAAVTVLADVCLLVFAAALIAVLLDGAARWVSRRTRLERGWCLLAVTLALAVAIGAFVWWRGEASADEVGDLWLRLRAQAQSVAERAARSSWGPGLIDRARGWLEVAQGQAAGRAAGLVAGFVGSTLGIVGGLVLVLVTGVYLAATPRTYVDGTLMLLPPRWRRRGEAVLGRIADTLHWWFLGQLMDMLVVAVLSWIGLALLGVPLAGTLALVAGLLNFVPYIGALAGAVPAVLVALGQGPDQALYVALLFTAVQMLEGNLIGPLIQRQTIRVPPVLIILSQTVFGTLFGVLGLVLAPPLAAAGLIAVRMLYVADVLGDRAGDAELGED